MKYADRIDPELRPIAWRVPYRRALFPGANLALALAFRLTPIPEGVAHRRIALRGYQRRKFWVDVFEPSGSVGALPALIDVHGGAFSYGPSVHHKRLACLYAGRAQCRVFFPHYHRAPRHPYPAACEDVLALYRFIEANSEALGVDREAIGLAGDSAGASIAALICNRHESEGLKRPRAQMLIYPVTDGCARTDSMERFSDAPLWNARHNRRMWAYYCPADQVRAASPMHSALPSILPRTYIETAEFDCLHDEGLRYGEKLRRAGASVEINDTRGTFHGYDLALRTSIAARHAARRVAFLEKALHGPGE